MEPQYFIFVAWGVILLAIVIVLVRAVQRYRAGNRAIVERGWRRLPNDLALVNGWSGYPFAKALADRKIRDVVAGQVDGVDFLSLRWRQREHYTSASSRNGIDDWETYNIVAVRCETGLPAMSFIRGNHAIRKDAVPSGTEDYTIGERRFDRRWQLLGDPELGRALLTPEVRETMEDLGFSWVFQPGWVTRVLPWRYYGGEDAMVDEVRRVAAPWARAPYDVWSRYGGIPAFVTRLGGVPGRES